MRPRKLAYWLLSAIMSYAFTAATQTASVFQQLSFKEALKSKGVDASSKEALRKALSSKDEQVRGLAALRLSEMNDSASVSDLEKSLVSEQSGEATLRIATALARFHSLSGELALENICNREGASARLVVAAADALHVYGVGDVPTYCAPSLMRIANARDHYQPADRANALDALVSVSVSPELHQAETLTAAALLNDPSSIVRASSMRLLAQTPSPETTALLMRASEVEKNAAVRGLIEDSLSKAARN